MLITLTAIFILLLLSFKETIQGNHWM